MKRRYLLAATLVGVLALAGLAAAQSADPSADPQNAPQITAEQQKQLDNLKGLEQQLQKDSEAVHSAISQYSRDSDKTDAAMQQLFNTRMQYRQLCRSLRQAGVPVPPPAGAGAGWRAGGPVQGWERAYGYGRGFGGPAQGWGRRYGYGRGFARRGCQCPCWGY